MILAWKMAFKNKAVPSVLFFYEKAVMEQVPQEPVSGPAPISIYRDVKSFSSAVNLDNIWPKEPKCYLSIPVRSCYSSASCRKSILHIMCVYCRY